VLLVPLGDRVDRRKLAFRLLLVCSGGLVLAASAPTLPVLAIALGVVASTSVVLQILIPFASTLAAEAERGRVVGTVVSGALTGILLARTASGLLASAAGWRAPFIVAAVAMAVLSVALWRALPRVAPQPTVAYRRLLRSIGTLVAAEPLLRRRMAYGACGFACFTVVWTAIVFLLSGPPFHYGERTIGLFGLAGLAGALGAQGFGRLADRGRGRPATGAVLFILLGSWGILALAASSVVAVVLGLAALDFAVQGQNVLSQGAIYSLGRSTASRVTTAYVAANFAGGALGSLVTSIAWSAGGWDAVCAAGAAFAAVAVCLWMTEPALPARTRAP
jgi:predicted MFS family arabinose efflux permease